MGRGCKYKATREGHKVCSRCAIEKTYAEFGTHKFTRSGLDAWCRVCKREWGRMSKRVRSAASQRAAYEKYRRNNREKIRACQHAKYLRRKAARDALRMILASYVLDPAPPNAV